MPILSPKLEFPVSSPELPTPIMFRSAWVPSKGVYPLHEHAWGEFVYSFSCVMEVKVADHHYLAPPQCGLWLPPDLAHAGSNKEEAHHCSLYVSRKLCEALPATPCALTVTPLVRALLDHLCRQPPAQPAAAQDARLLRVLLDQLVLAPRAGSYLPTSDDTQLGAVLRLLEANPADNRSLPELAQTAHTTERTVPILFITASYA